jgi:hypothetical protein
VYLNNIMLAQTIIEAPIERDGTAVPDPQWFSHMDISLPRQGLVQPFVHEGMLLWSVKQPHRFVFPQNSGILRGITVRLYAISGTGFQEEHAQRDWLAVLREADPYFASRMVLAQSPYIALVQKLDDPKSPPSQYPAAIVATTDYEAEPPL